MAHGGARSGAGRPGGGISQARRVLVTAIERGLAGDIEGQMTEEVRIEQATQTAAQIAADMLGAGRGDQVLALYAASAPKSDQGDGNAAQSALQNALDRLGSGADSHETPIDTQTASKTVAGTRVYGEPSTDSTPVEGYNPPSIPSQHGLFPASGRDQAPSGGEGGAPPLSPRPEGIPVEREIFEKITENFPL
ncbi:MAG: hypothetical protein RPU39_13690 [Candidatus Sedimenticola sp. (ex Thyasira tokunagai)]